METFILRNSSPGALCVAPLVVKTGRLRNEELDGKKSNDNELYSQTVSVIVFINIL